MRLKLSLLASKLIAILVTLTYCLSAWFLGNLFITLTTKTGMKDLPTLSRIGIAPLNAEVEINMIHWQLAALASLTIALARTSLRGELQHSGYRGIVDHYGVLLLLLLIHLSGFAAAFTIIVYNIE